MPTSKYTEITTKEQYYQYCNILEEIVFSNIKRTKEIQAEIDLLTSLIEAYDEKYNIFKAQNI